jgi:Fic family protein
MDIIKLLADYEQLGIAGVQDHAKFNLISIDHHSTRIEGSTLTAIETQVLINEGLTPKGKPLTDSLMVTDHHKALLYALEQAETAKGITTPFIKAINGLVMANTGKVYSTVFGEIDSSTGAFRKGNVVAGQSYFPNFDKVERLTNELSKALSDAMNRPLTREQQLNLSFDAHFNLVSIHPFYDGNGRTSRLLMNFIQAAYNIPLAIVHSDTKTDYYEALIRTREENNIDIFREFMYVQYERQLSEEISKFREITDPKKGFGFTLMF